MSAKVGIWMPLYIGDYLADTMHLTTEQHGAYLLLIMAYWKNGGPLPSSDQQLAAICRMSVDAWSNAKAVLENFFDTSVDGKWINHRAEEEMANAGEKKLKAVNRAVNAANKRWGKGIDDAPSMPEALPEHMPEECPLPSPSPIKIKSSSDQQAESPKEKIPFEKIRMIYNDVCKGVLRESIKLSEQRKRNIRKCWAMNIDGATPFQSGDFWRQYFTDCLDDPHWTGANDRGWRADIEFLTRETSVLKVLERT